MGPIIGQNVERIAALRGQFAHEACGDNHCYPKFQALVGLLGGG